MIILDMLPLKMEVEDKEDFQILTSLEHFSDIFEDFFGEGFGGRRRRRANYRGSDLRYDLSITLEEAYKGKKQDIKFTTSEKCNTCSINGSKPGHEVGSCSMCGGRGQVRSSQVSSQFSRLVLSVGGAGEEITHPCTSCGGQGKKQATKDYL